MCWAVMKYLDEIGVPRNPVNCAWNCQPELERVPVGAVVLRVGESSRITADASGAAVDTIGRIDNNSRRTFTWQLYLGSRHGARGSDNAGENSYNAPDVRLWPSIHGVWRGDCHCRRAPVAAWKER